MVKLLAASDPRASIGRCGDFFTYLHCTPDGVPFYVGKGRGDRAMLVNSKRRNASHQAVVKKAGSGNIKVYVFHCESEDQAFADEKQQIAQLHRDGYDLVNRASGGQGSSGWNHSEETKRRIGKGLLGNKRAVGNKNCAGRVASAETIKKMSVSHQGKALGPGAIEKLKRRMRGNKYSLGTKQSPETIAKRVAKLIGNKSNTGRKLPLEQRLKMSLSQKARHQNNKGVLCR